MTGEQLEQWLAITSAHPIDGDNLRAVLSSPRFEQLGRAAHADHAGPCIVRKIARLPCWHYDVGIRNERGTGVEWFSGETIDEAVRAAAAYLKSTTETYTDRYEREARKRAKR